MHKNAPEINSNLHTAEYILLCACTEEVVNLNTKT